MIVSFGIRRSLVRIAEAGAGTASPEKLELSTLAKAGFKERADPDI
jgi:hypothetical protein